MVFFRIMYLWRYCCGMAAHIWWITRVSSLRFGCSGWACTLRFNRSHTCSIGFKSGLVAGHLSVRTLFAASITCVLLAAWHGAFYNDALHTCMMGVPARIIPTAWARSAMLILAIFNVFHKRQSTKNTFLPKTTTTMPCTRNAST